MTYYETALVLDSQLEEEGVNKRVQRYVDLLVANGAAEMHLDRRGVRKLAYNIKGKDGAWRVQADYTFILYQAPPEAIAPVEMELRLDEDVLRYMTVRYDRTPPSLEEPAEPRVRASDDDDDEKAEE